MQAATHGVGVCSRLCPPRYAIHTKACSKGVMRQRMQG